MVLIFGNPKIMYCPILDLNACLSFLRIHCFRFTGMSKRKIKTPNVVKPIFEAESPDELALVETAYRYNIRLINRAPGTATVIMPGV